MSTEARDIRKQVLPNGLVVITETMTHVRSVSVGVWVRNGSAGKCRRRTGWRTSWSTWSQGHGAEVGGSDRAGDGFRWRDAGRFTSKEQICFNAKVLDEHLPIAFDVIADLVLRPKSIPRM